MCVCVCVCVVNVCFCVCVRARVCVFLLPNNNLQLPEFRFEALSLLSSLLLHACYLNCQKVFDLQNLPFS